MWTGYLKGITHSKISQRKYIKGLEELLKPIMWLTASYSRENWTSKGKIQSGNIQDVAVLKTNASLHSALPRKSRTALPKSDKWRQLESLSCSGSAFLGWKHLLGSVRVGGTGGVVSLLQSCRCLSDSMCCFSPWIKNVVIMTEELQLCRNSGLGRNYFSFCVKLVFVNDNIFNLF